MEQLAKGLQDYLEDFNDYTVESDDDTIIVYLSENIATPLFAELIFEFALFNSLNYFIGVSIHGRLNFVSYKD